MGSLAMMVLKVCDKLVKIALTGGARKVSYIQEFIALRTVKVMSVNPFRFSCFSQQQVHLWKRNLSSPHIANAIWIFGWKKG